MPVRLVEPRRERPAGVGIRADHDALAAELAESRDDRGGGVRLRARIAQPAAVDLERRAGLDDRPEGGLLEVRSRGEVGGGDVRVQVALDDVEVADRVEQAGARRRDDLRVVRRNDLVERAARRPTRGRATPSTAIPASRAPTR